MQRIRIIIFLAILSILLPGCFVIKKMAGADIDPVRFAKAREAKMYEIRSLSAGNLARRLNSADPLENADITLWLGEEFLNKIAKNYKSSTGWLDETTPYLIQDVDLKVHNGSAIASLAILAKNQKYNVDVALTMDCLMTLELNGTDLVLKMEPFNISPDVQAGGLLSSADEIISNLIKINLANIGNSMPQMKIPLNIENKMSVPGSKTNIKDKMNLLVLNPQRDIIYRLKIKEILFFEKKTFVALNIEKAEVK